MRGWLLRAPLQYRPLNSAWNDTPRFEAPSNNYRVCGASASEPRVYVYCFRMNFNGTEFVCWSLDEDSYLLKVWTWTNKESLVYGGLVSIRFNSERSSFEQRFRGIGFHWQLVKTKLINLFHPPRGNALKVNRKNGSPFHLLGNSLMKNSDNSSWENQT